MRVCVVGVCIVVWFTVFFFLCGVSLGGGKRDCVGLFLGQNTLGYWTWLFILQTDLDCKCNPSNSSDAQRDRECQGLFQSDLSKKLNIDGLWTSPVNLLVIWSLWVNERRWDKGEKSQVRPQSVFCTWYKRWQSGLYNLTISFNLKIQVASPYIFVFRKL